MWIFKEATNEEEFRHGTKFPGSFYDEQGNRLSVIGTRLIEKILKVMNDEDNS